MSSKEKNICHEDSQLLVQAENLGKCYHLYDRIRHRLFQMFSFGQRQYFKEFWALKDISFHIKKGESIGILGKNGSGKSTLLQIIAGVLSPTCGTLKTQGRIAALLELGSGFNPEFTGRENAYLNGAILGLSKKEMDERMPEIEAFADVGNFFDQPVKLYSSGMMLRVAFAVQVQVEPDILIVDEALAVGDALFQKRCFNRITQLLEKGTSLFLVSHDVEAVRTFTQKAIILKNGRILDQGKSADMMLEYRKLMQEEELKMFLPPSIPKAHNDTSSKTYGTRDVTLNSVQTLNEKDLPENTFTSGDRLKIRVRFQCHKDINHLNVALRIRNKLGYKIYSWGTLNQDMEILSKKDNKPLFWNKSFKQGDIDEVTFLLQCNLAPDLYEIQTSLSLEATCDYKNQLVLEWKDEAAFFQVIPSPYNHFGGLFDLSMQADWKKEDDKPDAVLCN